MYGDSGKIDQRLFVAEQQADRHSDTAVVDVHRPPSTVASHCAISRLGAEGEAVADGGSDPARAVRGDRPVPHTLRQTGRSAAARR